MKRRDAPPLPAAAGRNRFSIGAWLFLRLLALIHLVAFASFWSQLDSLVGPHGLLHATRFFSAVHEQLGASAYFQLPSLCWIFGTGTFLHALCGAGILVALLLFAGVAPVACLVFLWASYLSACAAGQIFFNFQWDALLLETTLLALFVTPWKFLPLWHPHEPPRLGRLLLGWLLFRLMALAGVVKLASGDATWRDLSALTSHYETQPLPTPLAWFVHPLPAGWQRASCAGMFALELVVPFFLFAPRALRHNAALLLAAFMAAIALTGNYTFFNLLTIALCLLCLDDAWWRSLRTLLPRSPGRRCQLFVDNVAGAPRGQRLAVMAFATFAFAYTGAQALPVIFPRLGPLPGFEAVARIVAPLRSFSNYGLFAVMTRPRPELIFEGSADGREWRAYEFPHKPGDLQRRPTWVAPHQPRLDWQLWFAALGSPDQNRWVFALCAHLLRGTPGCSAPPRTKSLCGKTAPLCPGNPLRIPFHRRRDPRPHRPVVAPHSARNLPGAGLAEELNPLPEGINESMPGFLAFPIFSS